jgi:predicted RNA binding protein YcfA (HicA-like mRNA interferase family)
MGTDLGTGQLSRQTRRNALQYLTCPLFLFAGDGTRDRLHSCVSTLPPRYSELPQRLNSKIELTSKPAGVMARKIRELVKDLKAAGWFQVAGGKGSHRKFKHDKLPGAVLIPGHENDDAKPYLEKQVNNAVKGKVDARVTRIIKRHERD